MRIDLKVLVDLPTLSNRFLFYRTPTQQKNVFIFRVHMDCLPTKTILCHKIRVQFQKIEILEFVLSPQWNWIRNQCLKKVPNERNLNHTVFAVPTGALGRPPSGVQSRRTPSPQRSEWLVRPSRGEEGTWQLTSSSPHTQHCTKQCLTCTDACSSRTATPVWEPRCEWVAQSFAGRGREGWGWGRLPGSKALLWTAPKCGGSGLPDEVLELGPFLRKICSLSTLISYSWAFFVSCSFRVFINIKCAQKSSFGTVIEGAHWGP